MVFSEQAKETIQKRYLIKNKDGDLLEDEHGMLKRVADYIGQNNDERKEFYQAMAARKFLPNSPTLMNAGDNLTGTLSACFVVDVEDDMESIFEMIKDIALITKDSGGIGLNFSKLRHKGARVNSSGGKSSGVLSFMSVANETLGVVEQGGKRRGAGMAVLDCDHPEIMDFIKCKRNTDKYTNFNISVGIKTDFMEAVKNNLDWDLLDVKTKQIVQTVKARDIYKEICKEAHATGEPGIIFLDRVNEDNHFPDKIMSSNPCGEQFLEPYSSCNLASINLLAFYENKRFNEEAFIDTVRTVVRFLDNVIDVNRYTLDKIKNKTKDRRRIGLGVMGFADLLYKLGIRYGSQDCIDVINRIGYLLRTTAYTESEKLGTEKGFYPDIKLNKSHEKPRRNAQLLSIAPTGTISFMLGVSSGIEPNFSLSYTRKITDGQSVTIYNHMYEEWLKNNKDKPLPDYFVTTNDITAQEHVDVLAAWQKYVDNGISKTINLDNDTTVEHVEDAYLYAWENKCKGITVYRDGSRESQVLSVDTGETKAEPDSKLQNKRRPYYTSGKSFKLKTACGSMYLTVNEINGKPFETFINLGHKDGCVSSWCESTSRLLTQCLRSGADVNKIIKHLSGIQCCNVAFDKEKRILSCSDAIGKCLSEYYKIKIDDVSKDKYCPDCGNVLIFKEGCVTCDSCGYSKCGG